MLFTKHTFISRDQQPRVLTSKISSKYIPCSLCCKIPCVECIAEVLYGQAKVNRSSDGLEVQRFAAHPETTEAVKHWTCSSSVYRSVSQFTCCLVFAVRLLGVTSYAFLRFPNLAFLMLYSTGVGRGHGEDGFWCFCFYVFIHGEGYMH